MPMKDNVLRQTKPERPTESPQEIRELVCKDVTAVSDTQLIALVLATGTRVPGTRASTSGGGKSSWSSMELASNLLAEAGGQLSDLVRETCANAIDWRLYGIGKNIGARLIAAMELAERWRVGAGSAVSSAQASLEARPLSLAVFERQRTPSAVELVALVLGVRLPDIEIAERVVTVFGSLRGLIATLAFDAFESFHRKGHIYLRLPSTGLVIEHADLCRLVAAVEVARRHRGQTVVMTTEPDSLGLTSANLEKLLDPATPLDAELRQSLVEELRSHPELAADFVKLDRLATDSGTGNYQRAAEIHRMFHALSSRQGWRHPAEIVGEPVPYRALLSLTQATIDRATEPSARILEIQALLQHAERDAAAQPVATFVDALRGLKLSESGAARAFDDAQRGYLGTRTCS